MLPQRLNAFFSKIQPRPFCWGGLDVSIQSISSFVMVLPDGDENVRVICRFWIPERSLMLTHKTFIDHGFLQVTPGAVVDYDLIADQVIKEKENFRIKAVAFDRWGAQGVIRALDKRKIKVVSFGQGFVSMSAPMKEFERLNMAARMERDPNPVLDWMIGNVAICTDAAGNIKPDRQKSTGSISGMVALYMALGLMTGEMSSERR